MTSRKIVFWHGRTQKLVDKISTFCSYNTNTDEYFWEGTLDDFEKAWNGNFIVYYGTICITDKFHFGQC